MLTEAQSFRNDTLGKDIQAILWEIVVVEKDNLMNTVIGSSALLVQIRKNH
ncbi:MAG: hypothetical protein M3525_01730 [Acidobacteriota bacterium]|nr:hypothetical protein [Acidobacteriota bacterium]